MINKTLKSKMKNKKKIQFKSLTYYNYTFYVINKIFDISKIFQASRFRILKSSNYILLKAVNTNCANSLRIFYFFKKLMKYYHIFISIFYNF